MFKKTLIFSLIVTLMLMGLCTVASAAQNVANTSQKGSLLIFPEIVVGFGWDTVVKISNDYSTETWIKCYWVDRDQEIQDFLFRVTRNQPIWFRASDGLGTGSTGDKNQNPITVPPFAGPVGELKCWAVNYDNDPSGQISFNHLYGSAVLFNYPNNDAFEYNAWAFAARNVALGSPVGSPGTMVLSGSGTDPAYDACPQYLLYNFLSDGSSIIGKDGIPLSFAAPRLALIPCRQDLRQDRLPTCTKAKFDIWNENETKYTGAYQCLKCYFEDWLPNLGRTKDQDSGKLTGYGGEKFLYSSLHTTLARFRTTGVASTVCNNIFTAKGVDKCKSQVATPLLGVMISELHFGVGQSLIGTTGSTAGSGAATTILWDTQALPPEAPTK
jgi:hypothetical protein